MVVELVERHDATVLVAGLASPGDPLIRELLGNLRVPLFLLATNLGLPVELRVVQLAHLFNTLHESRKFLKLRPLVVGSAHRNADVDRLLNRRHSASFVLLHVVRSILRPPRSKRDYAAWRDGCRGVSKRERR